MDILVGDKGLFRFGPFVLDPVRRQLLHRGLILKLTPKQFETLAYLVENAGRVVDKDELMAAVWPGRIIEEGSLSQIVFQLRRSLKEADGESYIITAPGQGYRFAAPVHAGSDRPAPPNAARATAEPPASPAPGQAQASQRQARQPHLGWAAAGIFTLALATISSLTLMRGIRTDAFVPPPRSIAVLPFVNLSGDKTQDYFSDGVSEDLIDALGRVQALKVAARMSSFSFRTANTTIESIGRQLNVGTVLEGAVRRDGQIVRITVQLIDTVTGYQLWSQSYSRNLQDFLVLQDDIAAAVVSELKVTLFGGEAPYLAVGGTRNPQAHDAELHAERLMQSISESNYREALSALDEAVRLDPSYAEAHAQRARALGAIVGMWKQNPKKSDDESDEELREADKAVALAPNLALAHMERGSYFGLRLDLSTVAAEFAIAHGLNPGNAIVERGYATVQAELGHRAEAESAIRHVLDLDPLAASNYGRQGLILYMDRKYDEALAALRREEAIGGDDPMRTHFLMAMTHLAQGLPQAVLIDCKPGCSSKDMLLAIAYKKLGRDAEANASLASLPHGPEDDPAPDYADVYAQWGDREAALHWLKVAVDEHSAAMQGIRVEPLLDPIRNTSAFATIERQLHLPP